MDLAHKDENTGSTEERTIMMDSLNDFHTGEVNHDEPSYDSNPDTSDKSEENTLPDDEEDEV